MGLGFPVEIRPGQAIYEQIVYAVKRAVAAGTLKQGDRFPSVRTLSLALGVNPNTVQKAVGELTDRGFLEVHPGQGCFVAAQTPPSRAEGLRALGPALESLVVEASRLGLGEADLKRCISEHWQRLKKAER
jgi:GntR family transcriptional regulator